MIICADQILLLSVPDPLHPNTGILPPLRHPFVKELVNRLHFHMLLCSIQRNCCMLLLLFLPADVTKLKHVTCCCCFLLTLLAEMRSATCCWCSFLLTMLADLVVLLLLLLMLLAPQPACLILFV